MYTFHYVIWMAQICDLCELFQFYGFPLRISGNKHSSILFWSRAIPFHLHCYLGPAACMLASVYNVRLAHAEGQDRWIPSYFPYLPYVIWYGTLIILGPGRDELRLKSYRVFCLLSRMIKKIVLILKKVFSCEPA